MISGTRYDIMICTKLFSIHDKVLAFESLLDVQTSFDLFLQG